MTCLKCDRKATIRKLCDKHYAYAMRHGEIKPTYKSISQTGKQCSVDQCNKKCFSKGYCQHHYNRCYQYKNPRRMIDKSGWTPENVAWLAGIIEGEGCCYINRSNKNKRSYIYLKVKMTDFDTIYKIKKCVGHGTIEGPYRSKKNPTWKPNLSWILCGHTLLIEFLKVILPWMGKRRTKKIMKCIKILEDNLKLNVRDPYAN